MTADARSGSSWHGGSVRDAYFPRYLFNVIFSAILFVVLERC